MASLGVESSAPPSMILGTMERDDDDDGDSCFQAVQAAIKAGFRGFDLAERYSTQTQVGRAIQGAGISRDQLYLVNKIDGLPTGDYTAIKSRVCAMLDACNTTSFDLLLIHYPLRTNSDLSGSPDSLVDAESWAYYEQSIRESWDHMTRLRQEGLTKEVGVSNFYEQHLAVLARVVAESSGKLARVFAAQNFIDAAHPEISLVNLCNSNGIKVLAYRPLAFSAVYGFMENAGSLLNGAAEKKCCTSQQLILAWLLSRGIIPICSSQSPDHLKANHEASAVADRFSNDDSNIFDFLTEHGEMVDMMGGVDEYAFAFKAMGPASTARGELSE